ncbi:SAM-dependent methyltransferase [Saccharothrix sp. Mg75]|uniref:SAM-dependent methyltransferase n=1 Tax=Saccharothrix sp. Mg75 TaxID=3445357 RepID=UPI003EEA56BE
MRACPARASAYLLGGRVHTQADRGFAESLVARWPRWVVDLKASETLLTGTLRTLRARGYDQVIDLCPVLPTPEGPYFAFDAHTGVRLVRLDGDPGTAAQTAALLRGTPHRVVRCAPDRPGEAMAVIRTRRLLTPHHPVVLLAGMGALESEPLGSGLERMLAAWGTELPDGSLLVFTHDTDDARTPAQARAAGRARLLYTALDRAFTARSGAALAASLRTAGWLLTQPLTWASRGPAAGPGVAERFPARPDGRAASVLAGIAAYRPRHHTTTAPVNEAPATDTAWRVLPRGVDTGGGRR